MKQLKRYSVGLGVRVEVEIEVEVDANGDPIDTDKDIDHMALDEAINLLPEGFHVYVDAAGADVQEAWTCRGD